MDRKEPTRIRQHGRKVTLSATGAERIAACRDIVNNETFAKIDGVMVDLFSASAIVKVYDAVNETNKAKFEKMPIGKMARIALQTDRLTRCQ